MKTDDSIKNICIAAIKRHTFKPIDYSLTKILDEGVIPKLPKGFPIQQGELPISQTFIDTSNWTLITTRRIISCLNNETREAAAGQISTWRWGAVFKNDKISPFSTGEIILDNGEVLKIYIESGKASMITIYAVMTLARLVK